MKHMTTAMEIRRSADEVLEVHSHSGQSMIQGSGVETF